MVLSLSLLSCEWPVSVKENPDRKRKTKKQRDNHLVEKFCVYLQAKTQLHPPCCIGGTLGVHGHTRPMTVFNVCLHAKNKHHNSLLSYNITF